MKRTTLLICCLLIASALPVFGQEKSGGIASGGLTEEAAGTYSVRGQLSPIQHTILSSELAANVRTLRLREGDRFAAGRRLAGLDCSVYMAQLKKAEAAAAASRKIYEVNQRLDSMDANSIIDLEQAAGKMMEAEALMEAMKVTAGKCNIMAPFSGFVVERYVQPHQYVKPGDPLLMIVNPDLLEIRLIVPSKWLSWLRKGTRLQFLVEENGKTYPASVIRLGAQIDPVSQSIPVMAKISGKGSGLLPGMNGVATFAPK